MAYDPMLDFDAQEQEMLQQAARIKALRSMNLGTTIDQPESFRSAVTGASFLAPQVKTPLLSQLTPLIQDTVAGVQENRLNQQRSVLTKAQQAEMNAALAATPQARQVQQLEVGATGPELETVTAQPTQQEQLAHAGRLTSNPMTRPLGQAILQDIYLKGPEREHAFKLESQKQRAVNLQKALDREAQLEAARIKAMAGSKDYKDSGLLDDKGAKIYATADGKKFSANYPLEGPMTPPTGGVAPTSRVLEGAAPAPTTMNQTAQDTVADAGRRVTVLKDFKARYATEQPTGWAARASQTGVLANEAAQTGIFGADVAKKAAYWSEFQEEINNQLRDLSGLTVTNQELARQSRTVPTSLTDPKLVDQWFDRQIAITNVGAARTQALASNKFARFDTKLQAIVDTTTGKVVPGTESPFADETPKAAAPAPAPAAAPKAEMGKVTPQEQRVRDRDSEAILTDELAKERGVLDRAKTPEERERAQSNIKAIEAELAGKKKKKGLQIGDIEEGYRYKGGPKGSESSWEKV